jgi:3-keto-disaccharide hydrolase
MRPLFTLTAILAGTALVAGALLPEGKPLFNGKDLSGWRLRNPKAAERSKWEVVGGVGLKEGMPGQFAPKQGKGVLLNGKDGHGVDLLSEEQHGDCELYLEFNVPKGSNSGVYFMGQYEVQILDSFGKKDLKYGDCGGIYNTAPPRTNASKAPGEWQSFHVFFRAPRFESGKKVAPARFIKVIHNGTVIHENVDVKGPTTASLGGTEKPTGPLLLQGDHGPVAFRNIRLKHLKAGK